MTEWLMPTDNFARGVGLMNTHLHNTETDAPFAKYYIPFGILIDQL